MLLGRPRVRHDRTRLDRVAIAVVTVFLLVAAAGKAAGNTADAISWGHDSDGNTTITIVCAEPLESSAFRSYPIADPPRAVIVIGGITNRLKPDVMAIGDRHVTRLRLGYSAVGSPPELNVILDLASDDAQVLDILHTRNRLVAVIGSPIHIGSSPATQTPPAAVPTSSPVASLTPTPGIVDPSPTSTETPTKTPTETPTPTDTPTETATEAPTPTMAPALTVVPGHPEPPAPSVPPVMTPTSTLAPRPSSTPTDPAVAFPTPTPEPESETASRVVDIVAILRNDGSTLLRITADGRMPYGIARTLEITDEPPRIILSLRGLRAPDLPRTIEISDPNLDRIRLVHDAETSEGELHLVLHLERPGVSVIDLNQVGPHLVLLLAAEKTADSTP